MRAWVSDAERNHNEMVFSYNNYSQKCQRLTLGPLLLLNYIIICKLLLITQICQGFIISSVSNCNFEEG